MNLKARNDAKPALRIIPREQHTISRKNISKAALRVLYRLNEAGYHAYLVGGAVRDLLLGGHPKDFDVATSATPDEVKKLFRNCRLIGRRFRLAHVVYGPEIIEVATFRGTSEEEGEGDRHIVDGRIVRDNVWGTIEEDALRRDFRVNAMYYDISDFSVRDYVGGMQDLQDRVLRLIGDPDDALSRRSGAHAARGAPGGEAGFSYRSGGVGAVRGARAVAERRGAGAPVRRIAEDVSHRAWLEELPHARAVRPAQVHVPGHGACAQARRQGVALVDRARPGKTPTNASPKASRSRRLSCLPYCCGARCAIWRTRGRRHGKDANEAWSRAAMHVVAEQCQRVAIPRRFTITMEEIWSLQPRFEQIQRKKVFRLLAHPRFRAAFDFLLLRAAESPAIGELGQWWAHAQQLPHETLAAALPLQQHGGSAGDIEPYGPCQCAAQA